MARDSFMLYEGKLILFPYTLYLSVSLCLQIYTLDT